MREGRGKEKEKNFLGIIKNGRLGNMGDEKRSVF
jgi:hypothetical protein